MSHDPNPYASPSLESLGAVVEPAHDLADAETIRRQYLRHEASIRSIGTLYYMASTMTLLGSLMIIPTLLLPANGPRGQAANNGPWVTPIFAGMIAVMVAIGIFIFITARWLRALDRRARIGVGIIAGIGLLGGPFGFIINAYFLYLVFSSKGQFVFSDEYQEIRRLTPHMKYRTSAVAWFVLMAFLALMGFIVFGSVH